MKDSARNRKELNKKLDLIVSEIKANLFVFANWFPHSKKKAFFTRLEGRDLVTEMSDVTFGGYFESWWVRMAPGMSKSKKRDYTSIVNYHLLPYFGELTFKQINLVKMKAFLSQLAATKTTRGTKLSAKRIRNVFIPLHQIIVDAYDDFGWSERKMPAFKKLKLPKVRKTIVNPFSYQEWKMIMAKMQEMHPWYVPYFEFAVLTGLRPSEQVALKWSDIHGGRIWIQSSRVRNLEKSELKNEFSRRDIEFNATIKKVIDEQRRMTAHFKSDYIFINTQGRPILQDKLRELWMRLMSKIDVIRFSIKLQ